MLAWLVPEKVSCVAWLMSSRTRQSARATATRHVNARHTHIKDASCFPLRFILGGIAIKDGEEGSASFTVWNRLHS
jgi:hypothetical protein